MILSLKPLLGKIYGWIQSRSNVGLRPSSGQLSTTIAEKFGAIIKIGPEEALGELALDGPDKSVTKSIGKMLFYCIVLIPMLGYSVYILYFASDQYVSETRFVVRSISSTKNESKSDKVTIGVTQLTQDAHITANYIKSPEMVHKLQSRLDIKALYSSRNIDYFSRLPQGVSWEKLYDYWSDQVMTYVDGPSGIIVLKIRAFSPNEAQLLSDAVLEECQTLVNSLSVRAKQDLALRAEAEVRRKFEEYRASLQKLREYQDQVGILDPIASASAIEKTIAGLAKRKLDAQSRLYVLKNTGVTDTANTRQLEQRIKAIDTQLTELEGRLTGNGVDNDQISAVLVPFTKLETDKLLAEKLYEAASEGLNAARTTELRRTINLSIFSGPSLPDDATYPRRFANIFIVAFGLFMFWAMLLLAWASIEDHRE